VPAPVDFFDARREWSQWKHEILRRYLPKFAGILGSAYPVVYYVDCFAGAGTYKGHQPAPGSPLIAAELAKTVALSGKWSYELRCINVEPNGSYFQQLANSTAEYGSRIQNLHGSFSERLSEILAVIGNSPTLFFLDPFGYKGMEWRAIKRLAVRSKVAKTEMLINFNVGKVDRDAGWLDSYNQPAAAAFVQGVSELMGTTDWQNVYDESQPKPTRDRALTDFYSHRLAQSFGGGTARYAVRTAKGAVKYFVLHVANHPRAYREMSDVIYRVEADYGAAKELLELQRGKQLSMDTFFNPAPPPDEAEADSILRLADDIYELGKKGGVATFGQLQDALAPRWFGRAIEKHYRAACKELVRQGKIEREKETGIGEGTWLKFV